MVLLQKKSTRVEKAAELNIRPVVARATTIIVMLSSNHMPSNEMN
ncbi:MAG TPA: hypothetical protein VJ729_13805 [Nitrososphaeraceae archaeon]|jgi:hypothetical protein|nr:hypothetical protein [Nitrososphaeraceae archaeon]